MAKCKYIERFLLGAVGALGTALVQETYRAYRCLDPVTTIIKEKQRKKRFDNIIAQTDLKN